MYSSYMPFAWVPNLRLRQLSFIKTASVLTLIPIIQLKNATTIEILQQLPHFAITGNLQVRIKLKEWF